MRNAEDITFLIRRRVESRYRRIVFVHRELAKVAKAAVRKEGTGSFDDLVFSTIDFSLYRKIDADEFTLLFDDGLDDFEPSFYEKAFNTGREEVRRAIFRSYSKDGPLYVCRKTGPLLLSIMRSLHTSLEFAPLLSPDDLCGTPQETEARCRSLVAALDGVSIRHEDGMETKLFTPDKAKPVLRGTFYPLGKAHTITLIP